MCHVWFAPQQSQRWHLWSKSGELQNIISFIGLFCKRDLWFICATAIRDIMCATAMRNVMCATAMRNVMYATAMRNVISATAMRNVICATAMRNVMRATANHIARHRATGVIPIKCEMHMCDKTHTHMRQNMRQNSSLCVMIYLFVTLYSELIPICNDILRTHSYL